MAREFVAQRIRNGILDMAVRGCWTWGMFGVRVFFPGKLYIYTSQMVVDTYGDGLMGVSIHEPAPGVQKRVCRTTQ
jgi:hypothetical protein